MYIRLDTVGFNKKPDKNEIAGINKRLSADSKDVEWPLFCNLVGNNGHSFCISDFYGERKNSNFKSQQIFALDFDNTAVYDDIKVRAEKYRLPIALSYETFSSKNRSSFRVVFLLDAAVTDTETSNSVTQMLMEIFYECDRKCSDHARMFFGGKEIIEQSGETVSLETLNIEFNRFCKDKYGEKHYKEKVSRFAGKNNINTKNGFTDITDGIARESIYKTRNFSFE
ncbi:MAG: hypothetical protein SPF92_06130, partial [Clostridia bacterium]|nr:hypothetical protein [Clostridia bacterium]